MNRDERDALAEEQGYNVCPHSVETYVLCDGDCKNCEISIAFEKDVKEGEYP
jgi:hypothetical protein